MQHEIDELKKKLSPYGEGTHHLTPSCHPRIQMMLCIDEDPELHPVRLSLATRIITISVRIRAQPKRPRE